MMDLDDFRSVLKESGVDLWSFIDTAISVACVDYGEELKNRRDEIVARLYATNAPRCRNCFSLEDSRPNGTETGEKGKKKNGTEEDVEIDKRASASPCTPQSNNREKEEEEEEEEEEEKQRESDEEEEEDRDRNYGRSIDEQSKILAIKEFLEDPDQSEDSLVDLLQNLADMDITFKALKETDIGRHVNRLRKHSSSEVRRLVKQLVRKWKDLVDEWVKLNTPGESAAATTIIGGDSPQQIPTTKGNHNGNQVPDFGYSPNPHPNGSSGSDKHNHEYDSKGKGIGIPRRELQAKQNKSPNVSTTVNRQKESKESLIDPEKLASARRRLHENYQEAQNAKKQRTIQVMDLHDIPKPKNSFFARNKGGFQAKHW